MNKLLYSVATVALLTAAPASAQILGGGVGGQLGGTLGGTVDGVRGTGGSMLDSTVERTRTTAEATARARARATARAERDARRANRNRGVTAAVAGDAAAVSGVRPGERRITSSSYASADARLTLDQRLLRTRGAVAATRRGLRRVKATVAGVQVFVPSVVVAGPLLPSVTVHSYPAFSGAYYYGPDAVFVGSTYVDGYMDQQYQDLEASLRGTGATVERRGDDLVVLFPADVTFAFDRSEIRPRFFGALSAFARIVNAYPGTDIEIMGHTDSVGSETYNLGLSERRGRSVADFLSARQISSARMVVEALGEAEPVASNATVDGRAANRRVELIVHPRAG